MGEILSSVVIFFASIIKFSITSLTVVSAQLGLGSALANIIGGMAGIVLFTYLGSVMQTYLAKKFPKRFGRRFNSTTRFLVKVKQRFGLGGIAALTPVLLSIPVGVIFALSVTHDKKKIMLSMISSILFWAAVFFLPYYLFDINILDWIRSIFESGS